MRTLSPDNPNCSNQAISTNGRLADRIWEPEIPLFPETMGSLITLCESHMFEQCGLLTVEQDIFRIRNAHTEPRHNFYLDVDEAQTAFDEIYERRNSAVLGVWHTHPNNVPWPSARDLVGWPQPATWRYWIITNNEVIEWRLISHDDPGDRVRLL